MIFQNELEQVRIAKANELKATGYNPYPHFLSRDMSIADFKAKFAYIKDMDVEEKRASEECCIAGRLKLKRVAGKSTFANIEDEDGNFLNSIISPSTLTVISIKLSVGEP